MNTSGFQLLASALALTCSAAAVSAQGLPGEVLSELKISSIQGGFGGPLDDGVSFGSAVASIGDLNQDGTVDLAIGAPNDDQGGSNRGAIWIVFLDDEGAVFGWRKISDTEGFFEAALEDQDHFGASIAALGDLSGDGSLEIAVGAPGDDGLGPNRGAVYVLSLSPGGIVERFVEISQSMGGFTGGLDDSDAFGTSLAAVGDLNADGFQELAVGASGDDDGGPSRGAVWILFLGADGTVEGLQKISDNVGTFEGELKDFDQFGNAVAGPGSLDADGVPDLVVGAYGDDDGGPTLGAVWVLFLAPNGAVTSFQKISSLAGGFGGQLENSDAFGHSVAAIGDVDGNGVPDVAVGVLRDSDGGPQRGAVWVLHLDALGNVRSEVKISDTSGGFEGVLSDFDQFGFAVSAIGDFDGDGAVDLVAGAPGDDDGGSDRGAVYTLFLEGRFQAAVAARPGNNLNPDCANVLGVPEIAANWIIAIAAAGGGTMSALIVQAEPLAAPVFLPKFGELLIDLSSATLLVDVSPDGSHEIEIPNLPALSGAVVYSQGLRLGPPVQLCNAWDATIGY